MRNEYDSPDIAIMEIDTSALCQISFGLNEGDDQGAGSGGGFTPGSEGGFEDL